VTNIVGTINLFSNNLKEIQVVDKDVTLQIGQTGTTTCFCTPISTSLFWGTDRDSPASHVGLLQLLSAHGISYFLLIAILVILFLFPFYALTIEEIVF
jgi:hypothetical protein